MPWERRKVVRMLPRSKVFRVLAAGRAMNHTSCVFVVVNMMVALFKVVMEVRESRHHKFPPRVKGRIGQRQNAED